MPNEVNDDDENIFNENNVETDSYIDKKEQKHNVKEKKRNYVLRKKNKTYNQRMKEKKNQPSAVNQRRMNYEERKQIFK